MTPLTPSQRLEAYRWALENFRTHHDGPYLCDVLSDFCDRNGYSICYNSKTVFPEFGRRKPPEYQIDKFTEGWFPIDPTGNSLREALLIECIAEVEGVIEKEKVNS